MIACQFLGSNLFFTRNHFLCFDSFLGLSGFKNQGQQEKKSVLNICGWLGCACAISTQPRNKCVTKAWQKNDLRAELTYKHPPTLLISEKIGTPKKKPRPKSHKCRLPSRFRIYKHMCSHLFIIQ
jgi:hypothetical protein